MATYQKVLTGKGRYEHFQKKGRFAHLTLCGKPVDAERTAAASGAYYSCLTCAKAARS